MATRTLSVSRRIGAPAEHVYDVVSHLARMASLSPEYAGSWRLWRGPIHPGVRFVGWSRAAWRVWPTTCRVVTASRPTLARLADEVALRT